MRGRRDVEPLGLHLADLDVRRAQRLGVRAGGLDHRVRPVGDEDAPARLDELGREQAGVPEPGGDLEHRVAGLRRAARSTSARDTGSAERCIGSRRSLQPLAAASQRSRRRSRGRPSACSPSGTSTASTLPAARSITCGVHPHEAHVADRDSSARARAARRIAGASVRRDRRPPTARSAAAARNPASIRRRSPARAATGPAAGRPRRSPTPTRAVARVRSASCGEASLGLLAPALAALAAEVRGERQPVLSTSAGRAQQLAARRARELADERDAFGTSYGASRARQCSSSSSSSADAPSRSTTVATTTCPNARRRVRARAASATAGVRFQDRLDARGATFSPPLMITSSRRPRTVIAPAARGGRGRRCGAPARPSARRSAPSTRISPASSSAHARAEQRRAVRQDLRARLGHPVGRRRPGRPPRPRAPAARRRSRRRRGAPSAARAAHAARRRAGGCSVAGRARRASGPPGRAARRGRARCRSARGGSRSSPSIAERRRIERPPTCASGRQHSQRSAGPSPSATAEPSALHSQLP